MKLSTTALLFFIGLIVYAVFSGNPAPAGPASPSSSSAPASPSLLSSLMSTFKSRTPTSTAQPVEHTTWETSELFIVRGTIVDRPSAGLAVDCSVPSIPHPISYYGNVHADIYTPLPLGSAANQEELQSYGRLMAFEHGSVRPSTFDPGVWDTTKYLKGTVIITGYPAALLETGKKIKMVVAPNGSTPYRGQSVSSYSANYQLADDATASAPNNSWMWNGRSSSLDKKK